MKYAVTVEFDVNTDEEANSIATDIEQTLAKGNDPIPAVWERYIDVAQGFPHEVTVRAVTGWTAIGYHRGDDPGDKRIVGLVRGHVDVEGGDVADPFAEHVEADTWEAAQELARWNDGDQHSCKPT